VSLTTAGEHYYAHVRTALDTVRGAGHNVGRHRRESVLAISVLPTFLNRWLSPRLRRFTETHPQIELHICGEYRSVDFGSEDVDMAVRYGDGDFEGLHSRLLFQETNTPVCTNETLQKMLGERSMASLRPEDIVKMPLLFSSTCSLNWNEWFVFAGCPDVDTEISSVHYDSCMGALSGARDGVGIAVANVPYVQKELESGQLVAPFAIVQPKRQGWYIVFPPDSEQLEKVQAFEAWLLEESAIMAIEIMAELRFGKPAA